MKQKQWVGALLGLCLLAPLAMSNSPAPVYPTIDKDTYLYSASLKYVGSQNGAYDYGLIVDNASAADFLVTGIDIVTAKQSYTSYYAFQSTYAFVPSFTTSLPFYFEVANVSDWSVDPTDFAVSIRGEVSQGTHYHDDHFTHKGERVVDASSENSSYSSKFNVTVLASARDSFALSDTTLSGHSFKLVDYYTYRAKTVCFTSLYFDGSFYGKDLESHSLAVADREKTVVPADFAYDHSEIVASDPNATQPSQLRLFGFSGFVRNVLLAVFGVLACCALALVIVAVIQIARAGKNANKVRMS